MKTRLLVIVSIIASLVLPFTPNMVPSVALAPQVASGPANSSWPVDANGTIYFSATNGKLFAINPNGTAKWKFQTPSSGLGPTAATGSDGTLYFGGGGGVYAIGDRGTSVATQVDLRDHSPIPATSLAFVGQPVVWTNNGTKTQTIIEGNPIFRVYLPVLLRGVSESAAVNGYFSAQSSNVSHVPLFDSGPLEPGEQFTHTFTASGVFTYYSRYSPAEVVGRVAAVQAGETVTSTVSAHTGISMTSPSGAGLQIASADLVTDTMATITTVSNFPITNTAGTVVGPAYNLNIDWFGYMVSGTVTVTLPYNQTSLPPGTDETRLRPSYFNGRSWIGVAGSVDIVEDRIVFTTIHLSPWEIIFPCNESFGLTDGEEYAYEDARDYLSALADHQDLFEVFTTRDGTPLFQLHVNEADWLSRQSLCDLERAGRSGILENLHVDRTPQQVVDSMIAVGEMLRSQAYEANRVREAWESLSNMGDWANRGLKVVELGFTPAFVLNLAADSFLDMFVSPIWQIAFDLAYAGELWQEFIGLNSWLQSSSVHEVGQSGLNHVPASHLENNIGTCYLNYTTSKGFYQIRVQGNPNINNPTASGFINLYEHFGAVSFVIGLQDLAPFVTSLIHIIGLNRTDYVMVLLEYQDASDQTLVARMKLENSRFIDICVLGKMTLPNIKPGSEVKVTYYFIEDGHLDKRFDSDGVQYPVPTGQRLCYGTCSGPNHSPNSPSNPSPVNGATNQVLNVGISWIGGDPDGDSVTYDVYFEANDSTPDVLASDDQISTSYITGTLNSNTHYYWQIVAKDEHGAMIPGPVWDFTTGTGEVCPITLTLQPPQTNNLRVTVSGTVTSTCSTITRLNWGWGDGVSEDQWFPASHAYTVSGTYPITVTAYNNLGQTKVQTTTAYVGLNTGEMVLVPAGNFQMGCDPAHNGGYSCTSWELPLHTVYLNAFRIDKYEVTNAQYKACVDAGVCASPANSSSYLRPSYYGNPAYDQYPVIYVSWYNARDYCAWAGKRLPTEAEWEKTARGSSDTRAYPWGDQSPNCTLANSYNEATSSDCVGDTSQVGSYLSGASPYGAMDLVGNVWEWVNDWWRSDYYRVSPSSNPPGPASGTDKVLRGGSFFVNWYYVRAGDRDYGGPPDSRDYCFGFRCVGVVPGQ
jgi:formylglycine-generating enzyme required for sulfatase activity/plastocyanin